MSEPAAVRPLVGASGADEKVRQDIRAELESAEADFRKLLGSLSDDDWRKQSLNPGWTNGEIAFHMTLGFNVLVNLVPLMRLWGRLPARASRAFAATLNMGTGLFNWINALGARGGGRLYTRQSLGRQFDRVTRRVLRLVDKMQADEWQMGMYYPQRWDALFDEFMTMERLFKYMLAHFRFHLGQIAW